MNNRNFKKQVSIKKIFSLLTIPFIFLAALSAQITQEDADEIVREHMRHKTWLYSVFSKEGGIQKNTTVITCAGEILELDYSCWVYFFCTYRKDSEHISMEKTGYLTVNESAGNVLEVNAKSNGGVGVDRPNDLNDKTKWRYVIIENHALVNTQWKLAGIVDAQTDILTELEPKNCANCYLLIFETDNMLITVVTLGVVEALYMLDYSTHKFQIVSTAGTKINEIGDGYLYNDLFRKSTIRSFSLQENELRLYYNDGNNYLLYNYMGVAW